LSFRLHTFLIAFIFFFSVLSGLAQDKYELGLLPSITISKQLNPLYNLSVQAESRQIFAEGSFFDSMDFNHQNSLTDLSLFGSRKVGLNNKLAAGYQMRLRDGEVIHRVNEQFTIVKKFRRFRLGQRLASDQTFKPDEDMTLRLRYRATPEIPLEGDAADVGEFYLKINNEYLNEFQDGDHELEIRLAPLLGYTFSARNKMEYGIDYRISLLMAGETEHTFWISLNWYFSM